MEAGMVPLRRVRFDVVRPTAARFSLTPGCEVGEGELAVADVLDDVVVQQPGPYGAELLWAAVEAAAQVVVV